MKHPSAASVAHFVLALLVALPGLARSALGEVSVLPPTVRFPTYQVRETWLESGSVIREYTSMSQRVFAVEWRGPVLPNLKQWLGAHHDIYVRAAQAARATGLRGGPLVVADQELVLRSSGRMREFQGHAYLVDQVPAGVDIRDVLR